MIISTPARPTERYGVEAIDCHTDGTVALILWRKRRQEIAELLEASLKKHSTGTVYVAAWDNSNAHEVEAVPRTTAGRLMLLYLPTWSPWLEPIGMIWYHLRCEVTRCGLFSNIKRWSQRPTISSSVTTGGLGRSSRSSALAPRKFCNCA